MTEVLPRQGFYISSKPLSNLSLHLLAPSSPRPMSQASTSPPSPPNSILLLPALNQGSSPIPLSPESPWNLEGAEIEYFVLANMCTRDTAILALRDSVIEDLVGSVTTTL